MADLKLARDAAGVLRVRLARPARRNAIPLALWRELAGRFEAVARDRDVRAVVLGGEGEHFSAGADIAEFHAERADAAAGARYSAAVEACVNALMDLPQPSIAAISGYCLGGGCSLAMACDFRVAARDAVFGIPAARLGIVYGVTDTRNLVSLVGPARARRMLFGAMRVPARVALDWGLVDELAGDDPLAAAEALAAGFRDSAPLSIAGAKQVLARVSGRPVSDDALTALQQTALQSDDYREGVSAFLERRPARFSGT